jgi:ferredoxin
VLACAEGAIKIVDGKARLISESYCDGLGACIGDCPQGAITVEQREAAAFDEKAVHEHLARQAQSTAGTAACSGGGGDLPCGCPGSTAQTLVRDSVADSKTIEAESGAAPSQLGQWPVQIHLVPPHAPYLERAKLLITADCVPFAFADFHRRFLAGRAVLVGCPKLDDAGFYRAKLAQILGQNDIQSIEVVHMEVPCCHGLLKIVREALADAGKEIPLTVTTVGIRGDIVETREQVTA